MLNISIDSTCVLEANLKPLKKGTKATLEVGTSYPLYVP